MLLIRYPMQCRTPQLTLAGISISLGSEDGCRPECLRLELPLVISRNARLEEPTLTLRFKDERGVKKRLKRRGVTVGSCFGRLVALEAAGVGREFSTPSGVVARTAALCLGEACAWPAIAKS